MGDTRTVDGQKQVYFLGFGWIDDNDEPNVAIFVDGDGDINKMVECMDKNRRQVSYSTPQQRLFQREQPLLFCIENCETRTLFNLP